MSWEGDPQATAPIGRKASTNVMPVLESDSESDSWLFSLEYSLSLNPLWEYSLSLNPFSLGLWFCSEHFVVPTTH
jgi:hypothetical protein